MITYKHNHDYHNNNKNNNKNNNNNSYCKKMNNNNTQYSKETHQLQYRKFTKNDKLNSPCVVAVVP